MKRGNTRARTVWGLLKDEQRRRGVNQADMARIIGVSSSVYSKWVRNERIPDPDSCDRIADALHLDRDYVLDLAGHRPDLDQRAERLDEVRIRTILPKLDERALRTVRSLAEHELHEMEQWARTRESMRSV